VKITWGFSPFFMKYPGRSPEIDPIVLGLEKKTRCKWHMFLTVMLAQFGAYIGINRLV
jgi:hypothetical protein